uniref:Palmitoyltransferase n=1 Tax=Fibrocapsa japonica TaxID=94617 RepID=A0A7S2XXS5_9STRA|mmetsp:Transcript_11118/g.16385  ORF Transcript_11118/g.16385 Transcript_11118/m.16385 type:complete len:322 (+) Transcript_11118:1-966(+)
MRSTLNARTVLPARGFPPAFFLLPALGVLVGSLGWSYGLMAWGLVCYLSSGLVVRAMMQSDNYVQFGAAYSVVCICWLGYWVYLSPVASLLTNFLQAVLCFLMNYYMIQSFRTDPGSPSRPGGDWTDGPTLKPGQAQQLVHSILSNNQKLASSLCVTCMVRKQPRQHHCRSCRKCVERFDHHCPFVANCVGRRNHRYFVGFLFWTCLSLIMWMVLFYYYMYTFCPARVAVWGGLKWLFAAKRALAFCFLASGSSLLWVSPLLLQQIYLVCVGATTYDLIKGKLGFGRPSFKVMCYTFIAFLRGYHEKAQLNDESADPLLMV